MTHTLTHTGKRAGGNNGYKSAGDLILLEQKGPESVENQRLECRQLVGKDEVSGSNPDSSSIKSYRYRCVWRKARRINRFRAFSSPDFFF